jgi:hypothetical protein
VAVAASKNKTKQRQIPQLSFYIPVLHKQRDLQMRRLAVVREQNEMCLAPRYYYTVQSVYLSQFRPLDGHVRPDSGLLQPIETNDII